MSGMLLPLLEIPDAQIVIGNAPFSVLQRTHVQQAQRILQHTESRAILLDAPKP